MRARILLALALVAPALVATALTSPAHASSLGIGATTLTLTMDESAKDGTEIVARAHWSYVDAAGDPDPPTGSVLLEFRRTGTVAWKKYDDVPVELGEGRVALTPRDDGDFRLRFGGDDQLGAAVSGAQAFDNQPVLQLKVRAGQWNLPGPDKLGKSHTRADRAGHLVRDADLDVLVINEAVGPGANSLTNKPSSFAELVRKEIGSTWRIVTPTTSYNENYIVYDTKHVELIQQYPDRIIPGVGTASSGRHVTTALFKDIRTNTPYLVAGTHLVNGNRAGARTQSRTVAAEVTARSAGYPAVVMGDMNTSDKLTAITDLGMVDARLTADDKWASTYSTHNTYSLKAPRKDPYWIIDQIYLPKAWDITHWRTQLDTKSKKFIQPRASDHALIWFRALGPKV